MARLGRKTIAGAPLAADGSSPVMSRAEFDEASYLAANIDIAEAVAAGVYAEGWVHYERHGRAEGRVTRVIETREHKILAALDTSGLGLEVGPCHSPIAPKRAGYNVEILDYLNEDALKEHYAALRAEGIDVDGIEHVDYVWKGEPIAEVVGGASKYEWMIASHVLEHIPDPIRFLQGVAEILTPTGRFSMALPDKRYCFDHFQPLSNTGALLDAFTEERVKPTAGQVFQYFAHCAQLDGNIAWASGLGGEVEFRHDLTMGTNGWRGALDDADFGGEVHCWRFTPESFRLLIAELGTMGLIDLKIVDSRPTNGSEFFVTLGHGRTIVPEEERIALVRAAISSDHER